MLDFSDKPYQYFPPKRSPIVTWLMGFYNRLYYLPTIANLRTIEVSGQQQLHAQYRPTDRLLFVPNHPTHVDSYIYFEALRRTGISTLIMAAYDVFLRSRRDAWIMQHFGAFSVDREGTDRRAMKQAATTLTTGRHALTIFPEGNVYLQNDVVTPFNDGAALLALRSAKELAEKNVRVLAVPVSIKVTYAQDVREAVRNLLSELAAVVDTKLGDEHDPLAQLRQVGKAALARNLRQRGITMGEAPKLKQLLHNTAQHVLDQLEVKMDLTSKPGDSPIERVRKARRVIHQTRLDDEKAHDHTVAQTWADQAMLAHRILSYAGDYVESHTTVDRYAETVENLAEDIYGKMIPVFGPRCAYVLFNKPIDVSDYLESFNKKARIGVHELTEQCEQAVQQGIDQLNSANPHPGGELWDG